MVASHTSVPGHSTAPFAVSGAPPTKFKENNHTSTHTASSHRTDAFGHAFLFFFSLLAAFRTHFESGYVPQPQIPELAVFALYPSNKHAVS